MGIFISLADNNEIQNFGWTRPDFAENCGVEIEKYKWSFVQECFRETNVEKSDRAFIFLQLWSVRPPAMQLTAHYLKWCIVLRDLFLRNTKWFLSMSSSTLFCCAIYTMGFLFASASGLTEWPTACVKPLLEGNLTESLIKMWEYTFKLIPNI